MRQRVFRWGASIYKALAQSPVTRRYASRSFSRFCRNSAADLGLEHRIAGRTVRLDLRRGADRSIYLHGAADLRGVRAIEKVMRLLSPRTAWDIGANRGNHSAFMHRHCRRLFSFEPHAEEAARLAELFQGDARVKVLRLALSDETGRRAFFADEIETGNSTLEVDPALANSWVNAVTGDEIVADYGIRDLDFIKMDVEGHEAHVLRGLKHTLQSQRPLIIFEVLEAYAKAENIGDLLPSDYDLYGNKRGFIGPLRTAARSRVHPSGHGLAESSC